jgi:hypothetical protein
MASVTVFASVGVCRSKTIGSILCYVVSTGRPRANFATLYPMSLRETPSIRAASACTPLACSNARLTRPFSNAMSSSRRRCSDRPLAWVLKNKFIQQRNLRRTGDDARRLLKDQAANEHRPRLVAESNAPTDGHEKTTLVPKSTNPSKLCHPSLKGPVIFGSSEQML